MTLTCSGMNTHKPEGKIHHWLQLLRTPGVGPATAQQLLAHCGSVQAIFTEPKHAAALPGLRAETREHLLRGNHGDDTIAADLRWAEQADHHIITRDDARYPERLASLPQPPLLLYVWGDPDYLLQPQLAMVGSRNPTAAGRRTAQDFARYLANAGITITSGLARGIDAACHQGALDALAGTVALVAHGLDMIYPPEHRQLASQIAGNGAVVSEMPIGVGPQRSYFPRRNRLISGLTLGTLVVEAAVKSGSLITARHALEQGREIFAIPGSIHNPLARGCHQLIRDGAKLVETADDILQELAHVLPPNHGDQTATPADGGDENSANCAPPLDPDHQKLLKCLQFEPAAIDELVERSGFSAAEVASMLLILELKGSVVCDGGRYTRIA